MTHKSTVCYVILDYDFQLPTLGGPVTEARQTPEMVGTG